MGFVGSAQVSDCGVSVRYPEESMRRFPKEQIVAQIALDFVQASQSQQVVGINLVAPEDGRGAHGPAASTFAERTVACVVRPCGLSCI
jgi:hypothetical protein